MKMAGRKTSGAYALYGFIPQVDNGKHSAICTSCNRVLQNTAAVRLQKHRNSCAASRASGEPIRFPNLGIKKQSSSKAEVVKQDNSINYVKTEQSNTEFEDSNINDNTNYDEEVKPTKQKSPRITTHTKKRKSLHIVCNPPKPNSPTFDHDENPIMSPITALQSQQPEPFESFQTNDGMEVSGEDLMNIENELDMIQNVMPRSRASLILQEELTKAQTEYYRCKTAYFTKLNENSKIKRTLMLLESRKLQLEIAKLTNGS